VPIPGYETFMLPILQLASDDEEHSLAEARDVLAGQLKLTEEEIQGQPSSGCQSAFGDRSAYANQARIELMRRFPEDRRNRLTWHRWNRLTWHRWNRLTWHRWNRLTWHRCRRGTRRLRSKPSAASA